MLTADQTAPINATTNYQSVHTAYGYKGKYIDVRKFDKGRIYLYVKGNHASCSKAITFYFQVSPDCEHWFDIEPIAVTMSGTSVITSATSHSAVDLSTVGFFRLQRIANAEAAEATGYTAQVNAGLWLPL